MWLSFPLEGGLSVVLLLFTRVRGLPDTREWLVSPIPSARLLTRAVRTPRGLSRTTRRTSARSCGAARPQRRKAVATKARAFLGRAQPACRRHPAAAEASA